MKILVNYPDEDNKMCTTYYIVRALRQLGHEVIFSTQGREEGEVVLDVDGYPLIGKIDGLPHIYWETDSFMDRPSQNEDHDAKLFIGGSPYDLRKYPDGTGFLPHAADPELHLPIDVPKEYDIVMVGTMGHQYGERARFVEMLQERYHMLVTLTAPGLPYSEAMSRGKLIFNCSITHDNIPMRFFEGMAIGALVTNYTPYLDMYAQPYRHYIPYLSGVELIQNIDRYLSDDQAREELKIVARANVLARHTYVQRVQTLLGAL